MVILDIELEFNAARVALNKRWGDKGKRINAAWVQAKRDLAADFARDLLSRPLDGPVRVGLFYSSSCDIDAPLKAVFDAMQRICYKDDEQIEELVAKVIRYPGRHVLAVVVEELCDPSESTVFERYRQWRDYAVELEVDEC